MRARSRGEARLAPPRPLADCDRGTIESALSAPGTGWGADEKYPDLASKAAALLYALAKSQACADGNKRIALILTSAFIRINGGRIEATHDETEGVVLAAAISDTRRHDETVVDLTNWMRAHLIEEEPGS